MDKISVEDALRLENISLKKLVSQLQTKLVEKDEQLVFSSIKAKHGLEEGDEINPETLEIVRKQPAAEPEAAPAQAKPEPRVKRAQP